MTTIRCVFCRSDETDHVVEGGRVQVFCTNCGARGPATLCTVDANKAFTEGIKNIEALDTEGLRRLLNAIEDVDSEVSSIRYELDRYIEKQEKKSA